MKMAMMQIMMMTMWLPGVEIDEEEEEQLWEDLDKNEVADSPDEAASPVMPELQHDKEWRATRSGIRTHQNKDR
jgi:hypothetical protein